MNTSIVVGLGFGDEGKGKTTSYLCSLAKVPLVVRFNGGHQAGHNVVYNGKQHIFSSFGSGTLQGVPTYISEYCTIFPIAILNELHELKKKGVEPTLMIDPLCQITTPFDVLKNQFCDKTISHGTCGVGFGATIKRHEACYNLYAQDIFYSSIFKAKLENIINYYASILPEPEEGWKAKKTIFLEHIETLKDVITVEVPNFNNYADIIFEGAQGILLDQHFGFFPNVTPSNTTSQNAIELITEFDLPFPDIYYVTRCYQTRHGNGFMTNEDKILEDNFGINNVNETNKLDEFQGKFRTGTLDLDLINYALQCDNYSSKGLLKNLVITCLDQCKTTGIIPFTDSQGIHYGDKFTILNRLHAHFNKLLTSSGADVKHMEINNLALHLA